MATALLILQLIGALASVYAHVEELRPTRAAAQIAAARVLEDEIQCP